ncbi:hypothetical protein GX50_04818 [[Emmonsia] crescens]|uniref:Alpha/beta hydrolase fold-3 domain-containing protein n=1 Tax=[Emmonsia] crescens TaxID=73230 RepID=A0A2B7ZGV5_9EURO|nr:hypothetical protein GX50_04818 [Emmonsia crescens]
MGSVDIEDATCRRISKTSSMKVVSVGYRLPPKYKYTAGLNDCLQATMWTLEHFLVPSVVLMGDSGDTNLVFGVAMRLIDADKVKVLALVPFTPRLNPLWSPTIPHGNYFSALLYPGVKGLKKVYIVECGTDTLRDDTRSMKEDLEEAGVPIMYDAYSGYPDYLWPYPSQALAAASEKFHTNIFRTMEWTSQE